MNTKVTLILILLFGFLLRIWDINTNPPALYGDELTIALDADSLLKTGRDQLGNFLPLTFEMGAGRPAGYVYGSIPFIAIFGPTALGVRGLSILSGMGIIILLYLLSKRFFPEKVALAVTFMGAVSPWDISLSRGGFEAHFALFLALLGFYLYILAKEKPFLYIFSALSFGITLHTYPTYKVSLLLFLPLMFWFMGESEKVVKNKYFLAGVLIIITLGLLALSQTFIGGSENRFSNINIFSQTKLKESIEQKINFERTITELPQNLVKYFHNKPVEYGKVLVENYLQNFSVDFLVLHGDRNPRHNMATMGQIYFVEMILIAIGVLSLTIKRKVLIFLLFWIILSPIPTALVDTPHGLRSAFLLPPLLLLSGLGLSIVLNQKNKIILFLITIALLIQFVFFAQKVYFLSPSLYSNFWSYPAKATFDIVRQNKDKYDYIFLSDKISDIEYAYPVYAKIEPKDVITQNKNKHLIQGLSFKKFDNIYIGYIPDGEGEKFLENLDGSVLYISPPDSAKYLKNYETISGRVGLPILTIYKR